MSYNGTTVHLRGEMTIYQAAEQRQTLLSALEGGGPLTIDLAGVSDIDTAGIQVLMLAKKAALSAGQQLQLVAHSPAVLEVFELLRLSAFFGDPMVIEPPEPAR
jgi:anti-anti-sigma factor